MRKLLPLLLCVCSIAPNNTLSASSTITFVPPPMEGRISLGVYDSNSLCIRTLKTDADFSEFNRGLNGLVIEWDGRLEDSSFAPPGKYEVKGVVAAGLKVQAMQLENNDWSTDVPEHRVLQIHSAVSTSEGSVLLAKLAGGGAMLLQMPENTEQIMDFPAHMLAAQGTSRVVADASRALLIELGEFRTFPGNAISAIALEAGILYLAEGNILRMIALTETKETSMPLPFPAVSLSVREGKLWIVGGGKIQVHEGVEWKRFEPEALDYPVSILAGSEGSVWVVDHGSDFPGVKQFSADGEFLRSLSPGENDPWPVHVATDSPDHLLLIESASGVHTVRNLIRETVKAAGEEGQSVSTWRVDWQKSIRNPATPTAMEDADPAVVKVTLPPNALDDNKSSTVHLTSAIRDGFCFLQLQDGLPLLRVAPVHGAASSRVEAGNDRNEMRVILNDNAGRAIFTLINIRRMLPFNAGTYEWAGHSDKGIPSPDE